MTWPVIVFWFLLLFGLLHRSPFLIYFFFAMTAFGSLAVLPVDAAGGINLLAQPVCAVALILRVLLQRGSMPRALQLLTSPRELGLLLLFMIVSTLTTLFMPRLFAGMIDVITISGVSEGLQPLAPGGYNFTQLAYLALSAATIVIFALLAERPGFERILFRGLLAGGAALCATGIADVFANAAGVASWLEPFRTVSYVLLTDADVLGVRRVVGLMPEASSFGASCCVFGVALMHLTPSATGIWRFLAGGCTVLLLVFAALSTSSTAYVGLAFWALLILLSCFKQIFSNSGWRRLGPVLLILAAAAVVLTASVLLLKPEILAFPREMITTTLFQKVDSSSYLERMHWNQVAIDAFLGSHGLGVGLGSVRASNWFIALLSNTGSLGAVLMALFLLQLFTRKSRSGFGPAADMMGALKSTIFLNLILAALSATSADFGVGTGALYGSVFGLSLITASRLSVTKEPAQPSEAMANALRQPRALPQT